MSFFKSLLFILVAPLALFAAPDYTVEFAPQIMEAAQQIPACGELKQKANGYVYIDVSPQFVDVIYPLLEEYIRETQPGNYRLSPPSTRIGAHISVIVETEIVKNDIWNVEEIGQTFAFDLTELRSVKLLGQKAKKLYLIALESPELEALREKYGLPARLKGHDFHITIGYQKPGFEKSQSKEMARAA